MTLNLELTFNPYLGHVLITKTDYLTDLSLIQDCYKITSLSPFSAKTNGRRFLLKFTNDIPSTLTATFYFTSEINSHGILHDGWMEGQLYNCYHQLIAIPTYLYLI